MTRYAPFDNTPLREAHAAYLKEAIAKGNLTPLDYVRWMERQLADLQGKVDSISQLARHANTSYRTDDCIDAVSDIVDILNTIGG